MIKQEKIDLLVKLSDLITSGQEKKMETACDGKEQEIGFLIGLIYVKDIISNLIWQEIEK